MIIIDVLKSESTKISENTANAEYVNYNGIQIYILQGTRQIF